MLKQRYDSSEDVPEQFRELYSEVDGGFVFTGIEEAEDTRRIMGALEKEREMRKAAENRLRENQKKADLEQKKEQPEGPDSVYRERIGLLEEKIRAYEDSNRKRSIQDAVQAAATAAKVLDVAKQDIDIIAQSIFEIDEDDNIVAGQSAGKYRGLTPKEWVSAMRTERSHWWGQNIGGGATGDTGQHGISRFENLSNPWLKENWNVSEQARLLQQDREVAMRLAKKAGKRLDA